MCNRTDCACTIVQFCIKMVKCIDGCEMVGKSYFHKRRQNTPSGLKADQPPFGSYINRLCAGAG
jgi:hypothetical protein